ncbi:hypothetical protein L289_2736 [Acinetobacter gerneri DSM 14967 = CIP 107464 = MTCC 9824]|nr:hypothetical protein L289_2736 [Acinetobacter gerneri DSM 14967 = CIP 107464 = MTCC 9824]
MDVGTATLQRYEDNERSPDLEFLINMQKHSGCSLDYLVHGIESNIDDEENLLLRNYRNADSDLKRNILVLSFKSDNKKQKTKVVHNQKNDVQGQQIGDNNHQDNHFAPKQSATFNIDNVSGGEVNGIKNMK